MGAVENGSRGAADAVGDRVERRQSRNQRRRPGRRALPADGIDAGDTHGARLARRRGRRWAVARRADDIPGRRRESIPYALKYAFSDDASASGISLGGEALAHEHDRDGTQVGFGAVGIVAKRRFALDPLQAFRVEAGVDLPTARRRLDTGSGKPDWALDGSYSADHGDWHADVNVVDPRSGAKVSGRSRLQALGAIALSHPVDGPWSVAAELSGVRQHGVRGTVQALAALSIAIRRVLAVDFGAARSLNHASAAWQAFTGITMALGRLR